MFSFSKALAVIKSLISDFAAIAPVLSAFGVAVPQAAVVAAPMAVVLMDKAEEALGSGTGAQKKEAVSAGLNAFAGVMQTVSKGGQKETWNKVTPEVVSVLVDSIAKTANGMIRTDEPTDIVRGG